MPPSTPRSPCGTADRRPANTAIYWLTGTSASAIRLHYEDSHASEKPEGPTTVPLGVAMFAGDFQSIRPLVERDHSNVARWRSYDGNAAGKGPRGSGGHYAAHEATDVWVGDVREFAAGL